MKGDEMGRIDCLLTIAVLAMLMVAFRASAAEIGGAGENLIPNGGLEKDADGDGWPDGWPKAGNASWVEEDGNHYLAVEPYGGPQFELKLKPEWRFVSVKVRVRCRGVEHGEESYHDARVVMSWENADREHVDPWPDVLRGIGSFPWQVKQRLFPIPEEAEYLSIGTVNYGAAGTVDYDDFEVRGSAERPMADAPRPRGAENVWSLKHATRRTSATRGEVCLNGLWRFRPVLEAAGLQSIPRRPGWGWFKVPGSWSSDDSLRVRRGLGWSDLDMDEVRAAWYRREFTVPEGWDERRIELRLGMLQSRADVYVDDRSAGEVLWPAGSIEITELVEPGATHELAVLAVAAPREEGGRSFMGPGRAFEVEPELTYRGLCGDVFLTSRPADGGIENVSVRTSVREERIAVDTGLELPPGRRFRLRARVRHEGNTVKEFASDPFGRGDPGDDGRIVLSSDWADPPLWDTHHPRMLTLNLSLLDERGEVLDEALPVRFGFREIWTEGRDFYLNGKRLRLRALLLRCATAADTGTREACAEAFRRIRDYGFNFFIMPNYHFRVGGVNYFYDMLRAADEEGMLVSFSLPHVSQFDWSLDEAEGRDRYRELTEWVIRQAGNHPSVITYAMNHNACGYRGDQNPELLHGREPGPESRNRRQALVAQRIAEELDPTRFVYHHQSGNLGNMYTLNCYLNWAPIRERSRWLAEWGKRGVKPFFFVEWGLPHIASWSSYRGPAFIWRTDALQQAWPHEFAATFKGEEAYVMDETHRRALETELEFWRREEPFHWYHLSGLLQSHRTNVLDVRARYVEHNWPSHRTWGVSAILPWDQGSLWRRRPEASSGAERLQPDWDAVQSPGPSPDYAVHIDRYTSGLGPADEWEPTVLGRAFLRWNQPLIAWLAGREGRFTELDHNFTPGETVRKQAIIINDRREAVRCTWRWSLRDGPDGRGETLVGPGQVAREPIELRIPDGMPPGTYPLELTVETVDGARQEHGLEIHVRPVPEPRLKLDAEVALWDPNGDTAAELKRLGVPFTSVTAEDEIGGFDLLVVGRGALSVTGTAPDISAVPDGLNVLVFEQRAEVLGHRFGFRTQVYGLRRLFPRVADHPVLDGLPAEHLRDWRGDATLYPPYMESPGALNQYPQARWAGFTNSRVWRAGTGGNVATALIQKPPRGDFLPLVDGGFDLQYAPLLEWRKGAGRVLFCQMDVTGRSEADPAADRLLRNLLRYCASAADRTARRSLYYAGTERGLTTLRKLGFDPGQASVSELGAGDLLVIGPGASGPETDELRAALRRGLNMLMLENDAEELKRAPVELQIQEIETANSRLKTPLPDQVFAGLSCAETHFRNFLEVPAVVEEGSEVQTADQQGLLAVANVGKGKVVICQAAPWQFDPAEFEHDKPTYRRTACLVSRIMANLGAAARSPLLEFWAEPAVRLPELTEGWRGKVDPENEGVEAGWHRPDFDASDWRPIEVPATFESQRPDLSDYDGYFWYRRRFDMPVVPEDRDIYFVMGAVDDEDWTYLNGEMIGKVTAETHEEHYAVERRYRLPRELLKPKDNVLAVRARDTYLSGGIVRLPVALQTEGRWTDSFYVDEADANDDPYRYYRW